VQLAGEDLGMLEMEALCHLLKFNVACTELNGIVMDEGQTSLDMNLITIELYEVNKSKNI